MIIVLLEIIIYILFAWIMYKMVQKSICYYPSGCWNGYLILLVVVFSIICAVRFNVGGDYFSYAKIFYNGWIFNDKETLWNMFVMLIHKLGGHSVLGMGFVAFLQIYFIVKSIKKYPYILLFFPIVLFGGRYFIDLMGAMRQMTVACIFLWGSKYIYERKIWHYIIVIIVCSLIHHSALMLLPLYLIPNKFYIADKRVLMLIIFSICFIAGQTPAFQAFTSYAEGFANLTGYEEYSSRVGSFLEQGNTAEALRFGPMMLSYFASAVFIIWFGPQLKKQYGTRIPLFNMWYNFSFFYACGYFLICNVSHIFIRPIQYLELFQLVIAALLLYDFYLNRKKSMKMRILLCVFVAILWLNITWSISKEVNNSWNFITYKTLFTNQDILNQILNESY